TANENGKSREGIKIGNAPCPGSPRPTEGDSSLYSPGIIKIFIYPPPLPPSPFLSCCFSH
uniref:Uncharacterized protein n=1 Tax=Amphimedon queenslandica TaxID=400682 RepID=A0A1X7TA84_AMPQE